ncbi:hypothetical protein KY289_012929 [Solanum tuberosum]|nr:hypothetical protein KY289_012929 [Solanum tuberosum]
MANSLCFTPLASLNTFNKPGLINGNGNCAGRKIQLIKDVTFNSKSNLRVVEVKAADSDKETKVRSIVCQKCEGNGAVACSQCKGVGVNSVDHFNGRFKAGGLCWLCRGKKDILCGDCNGAGFLGGFMIESIEAMLHPALSRLSPMMPRIAQGLHYENKHIERLFVQKNVKSAMGESKCRKTLYLELKHPPNIKFKFVNNILDVISRVQSKEGDNLNTTDMAYASVASLLNTIQLLLTSDSQMRSQICDHREEFHALSEKVSSLEIFLKKFEKSNVSREMTDLEAQIKEVADGVEITIQLRLTDIIMAKNEMQKKKAREMLCDSLKQVAEEIDRVQKESTKIQYKAKQSLEEYFVQASSSAKVILNGKNNMVGRRDEREKMMTELTRGFSGVLKVIPIVGMGGIGKTTLAKEVFNDAFIRSHFDVRAWATISQEHNVKDILVSLLHSTKEKDDTVNTEDESKLADMLQKSLKSRRYLIVLDDMWSDKAWDDVRLCFPSENNGSRILLTTRNTEVACSAGTKNISLPIGLMGPVESWDLFKSAAFVNEALPSEFETVGKQIVDQCQGLPLTIVVVAGLLSKSKRTIEVWGSVAKDVKSFVTNDPDEQCLHVLGLSYNHLTSDLKACLLYFGIFPEDSEVSVKRLVRLWIAEGFLKFEKDLEGVAEKCLQDLIDRCLVLVSEKSLDETRVRYCKDEDKYDYVDKDDDDEDDEDLDEDEEDDSDIKEGKHGFGRYRTLLTPGHHHLIRRKTDDADNNLLKRTRSIFFNNSYSETFSLKSKLFHFSLLRILDLSFVLLERFPFQILCLVWLRYLELLGDFDIPTDICRLWNLQTFIVDGSPGDFGIYPKEIWELTQLRHLELTSFLLPNSPTVSVDGQRYLGLPNIHTILGLSHGCCTKEVISGIRNVRKLKVEGDNNDYEGFQESRLFNNLVHLQHLETLSVTIYADLEDSVPVTIPSAKAFPAILKKLKLYGTGLRWDDLNIVGELPNLEVLKVIFDAVGEECFPVLERLMIIDCTELEEIPIEFAETSSLKLIELKDCKPHLEDSATRIQQEQEDIGNNPVDVRISSKVREWRLSQTDIS